MYMDVAVEEGGKMMPGNLVVEGLLVENQLYLIMKMVFSELLK